MKKETLEKLAKGDSIIGIVRLGYVGLPLMLAYTAQGYNTVGFDIDQSKSYYFQG